MSKNMFSSEVELGKFLGSIDIILDAFNVVSDNSPTYQFHTSPSGIKVLAFNCPSDYTTRFLNREFDLVSSENHKVVDFIPTKNNSSFFINEVAVELFEHLPDDLKQHEKELINRPFVVTGRGLGGYCAILFTLWLQKVIDVEESNGYWESKRPICITFGSPLVGDEVLHDAIDELPQWKSCFLNVVTKTDLVASFFSSNSLYKPFGTFLFCTESGGHTAFGDQESVLAVLDTMASSRAENLEIHDYGNHLNSIRKKVLYRGVSESVDFNLNSLRKGIQLQLREVGVLDNISNDLIDRMEKKQATMITNKTNVFEPAKKLNKLKIKMSELERYINYCRSKGGYYDCFKNPKSRDEIDYKSKIITWQRTMNQYWVWFVKETERKPQKEDASMRKRWLYCGYNYKRMVEPLDIAYYYQNGNRNYQENRSDHYMKLDNLLSEDIKYLNSSNGKKKVADLTKDSCFWAHVEEALILLRDHNIVDINQKLVDFEVYFMTEINDYSVSPDIFINGSSFMEWWDKYKNYKGSSYTSEFAQYMNNETYKSYK